MTDVVVFVFVFCYGRILVVIRRQASVMAGHSRPHPQPTASDSVQLQRHQDADYCQCVLRSQLSCIPMYFLYFTTSLPIRVSRVLEVYYLLLFSSFLYFCANPFIYAIKFDPVKRVLARLIPCKKSEQPGNSVQT